MFGPILIEKLAEAIIGNIIMWCYITLQFNSIGIGNCIEKVFVENFTLSKYCRPNSISLCAYTFNMQLQAKLFMTRAYKKIEKFTWSQNWSSNRQWRPLVKPNKPESIFYSYWISFTGYQLTFHDWLNKIVIICKGNKYNCKHRHESDWVHFFSFFLFFK